MKIVSKTKEYFGLVPESESPLVLAAPPPGKVVTIRNAKRAKLLTFVEGATADELQFIYARRGRRWDVFRALGMNDTEIDQAIFEQLRFVRKLDSEQTLFFRRRVVAGIFLISVGVWVLVVLNVVGRLIL